MCFPRKLSIDFTSIHAQCSPLYFVRSITALIYNVSMRPPVTHSYMDGLRMPLTHGSHLQVGIFHSSCYIHCMASFTVCAPRNGWGVSLAWQFFVSVIFDIKSSTSFAVLITYSRLTARQRSFDQRIRQLDVDVIFFLLWAGGRCCGWVLVGRRQDRQTVSCTAFSGLFFISD